MRFTLLIITGFALKAYSQVDLSIHCGGGASLIYNTATANMNHSFYGSPVRSIPKKSFEAGLTARKYFERTFLETGLCYSIIQSLHQENTFALNLPNLNYTGNQIKIEKMRSIGYISIPVVLCRNYGSFSIGGGIQPQFTAYVKEDKKMWEGFGESLTPVEPKTDRRTIRQFDLGFIAQSNLAASDRISLNFKLYWGIANINNFEEKGVMYEFYEYESPVVDRRLKNRQFLITLQYKIWTKK